MFILTDVSRQQNCMCMLCIRGGRTRSRVPSFVWRNAKSFYCFSPWEKAGLRFQCTLKNTCHNKTTNKLFLSLSTLQRTCTKQLFTWPRRLTENISKCRLFYPTQVFGVRQKVNRATTPQHALANFSTRAVSILLLLQTSCISLCTILWNVNFITCT